jgi:small nuclear ribonucleoprotein (snRNP)-like protein
MATSNSTTWNLHAGEKVVVHLKHDRTIVGDIRCIIDDIFYILIDESKLLTCRFSDVELVERTSIKIGREWINLKKGQRVIFKQSNGRNIEGLIERVDSNGFFINQGFTTWISTKDIVWMETFDVQDIIDIARQYLVDRDKNVFNKRSEVVECPFCESRFVRYFYSSYELTSCSKCEKIFTIGDGLHW